MCCQRNSQIVWISVLTAPTYVWVFKGDLQRRFALGWLEIFSFHLPTTTAESHQLPIHVMGEAFTPSSLNGSMPDPAFGPPLGNYHKKSHLVSEWHLRHPQASWVLTKWWSEVLWSSALKSVLCCDTLSKDEVKSRARKANTALYFGEDPKTCPKRPKTKLSCVVELYEQESAEVQGHEMWILFLSQPHPSTNKSLCLRTKHTFSLCLQPWRPGPLPMGIAQSLFHGWFFSYLWNIFKVFCLLRILCCLIQEPVLCPSLLSLWVSLPYLVAFPNFLSSENFPSAFKQVETDKWIQELLGGG